MLIITATMHPGGSPAGSYEVMTGTVTNAGSVNGSTDEYAAHFLHRPNDRRGIEGWEADVAVQGYNSRLGLTPLLGAIFNAIDPVPLDFEPDVTLQRKLLLKEMDDFDKRLRGDR